MAVRYAVIFQWLMTNECKQSSANKKGDDILQKIEDHINSHNPAISHYHRKHAPLRRYISSELNPTLMFEDFCEQYPNLKISYTLLSVRVFKR